MDYETAATFFPLAVLHYETTANERERRWVSYRGLTFDFLQPRLCLFFIRKSIIGQRNICIGRLNSWIAIINPVLRRDPRFLFLFLTGDTALENKNYEAGDIIFLGIIQLQFFSCFLLLLKIGNVFFFLVNRSMNSHFQSSHVPEVSFFFIVNLWNQHVIA